MNARELELDARTLDAIADLMSEAEDWGADTLDRIAQLVRETGRPTGCDDDDDDDEAAAQEARDRLDDLAADRHSRWEQGA